MTADKSYFSHYSDLPSPSKIITEVSHEETSSEQPPEMYEDELPILRIQNIYVSFEGKLVLRNISFEVKRGETLAIIGESGCGKTVLLKTLIHLFQPESGSVMFEDKILSELSYFGLTEARTHFGYVFQQAALFDSLTIAENIAFPLVQHTKKTKEEIKETVLRLLHEVGLSDDTYHKKPAELSGGMRKRVGFARALAMEPALMLYDEPTTGLDPVMSGVINGLIADTRAKHDVTGIIVTHDIKAALQLSDRIIMLAPLAKISEDEAQIIFEGTPQEFIDSPDERVQKFLGK